MERVQRATPAGQWYQGGIAAGQVRQHLVGRALASLEQLVDPGRLSRGRSYARSGQVTALDISPEGVKAKVQGSHPRPYRVRIEFIRLGDEKWEAVADVLASQAIFAAEPEPEVEPFPDLDADETAPLLISTSAGDVNEAIAGELTADSVLHAFWSLPAGFTETPASLRPPPVEAMPIKVLGAPPFMPEAAELTRAMEIAYRTISERARHLAKGDR